MCTLDPFGVRGQAGLEQVVQEAENPPGGEQGSSKLKVKGLNQSEGRLRRIVEKKGAP